MPGAIETPPDRAGGDSGHHDEDLESFHLIDSLVCSRRAASFSSGSGAGMEFAVHRFQPLLVHMRVDLGGGNVCVSKHFLNYSEVRAVSEQVCGKAMADEVWID